MHKDTGVKTYFGADADFITVGVMGYPSWVFYSSEVQLPSGVTKISGDCFAECYDLTSITLPEGLTILGERCFYECHALTSINIPEGVTSLEYECFGGCDALTSITLPSSVTSLEHSCFSNCSSLILATVFPTTPPSLGAYAFYNVHTSFNIKVRSLYVNAYKTATNWSEYASKISAI